MPPFPLLLHPEDADGDAATLTAAILPSPSSSTPTGTPSAPGAATTGDRARPGGSELFMAASLFPWLPLCFDESGTSPFSPASLPSSRRFAVWTLRLRRRRTKFSAPASSPSTASRETASGPVYCAFFRARFTVPNLLPPGHPVQANVPVKGAVETDGFPAVRSM